MNDTETSLVSFSLFNVVNNQYCPQCGGKMNESDRCEEGSITYVWFECAKADCDGRWFTYLVKKEPWRSDNVK